jgi:predicted O-methyltransferase YrrM
MERFEDLPDLAVADGVRGGRVVREGYQRGWGIQFGDLAPKIENESLYRRAADSVSVPSWVATSKRQNLYLIMTRFISKLSSRNVVEFGSYKGGNALFMALVMKEVDPTAKVFALDTYEGMPTTDKSIDAHSVGDFADTSLPDLQARIAGLGLTNLVPVKGLFQETFPNLPSDLTFGLAHIDADIYSAVKYAQDAVWPRMTKGGYIAYDDADVSSCIGATQAVEELIMERSVHSEQVWPHFVFRAGLS